MSNKTSDKNVANVTKNDIDILNALIYVYEARLPNYNELMDSEVSAIKNILSDYTRQKQINEEHKKINGELRERIKELEEKNEHLSNTSDYETISLECVHLEEQLEIANSRIQELEEERNHWHGCFIVAMENSIAKEKVKDVLKNNRNEIFSTTYLSREQFRPYEMQIERINKIEQELLEGGK